MASRPPLSKPLSSTTGSGDSIPRTPCTIHSLAVVADRAQITGAQSFDLGENAVLHPYARVRTEGGRVSIGRCSSVCENAIIGSPDTGANDIAIGDSVTVEAGAVVEAKTVGDCTVIEVGAKIGRGAVVGKYCKINAMCQVTPYDTLPDFTVVHSDTCKRRDHSMANNPELREMKRKGQDMHVQLLRQLIPNAASKWS